MLHRTGNGFVRNYSARKKFTPTGCRFRLRYAAGCRNRRPSGGCHAPNYDASSPAAHAQTAPQQGPSQQIVPQQGPSQDVLAPAPKLNLTLEQRHTIKEFVKDMEADAADVQATVGEPIPPGINPRPMPNLSLTLMCA